MLALAAVLIGLLVGFTLTRDTTTAVPDVTGEQLSVAIALLEQSGFKVGEVSRVQRQTARNTVFEQEPVASPPAGQASLDCAFLNFLCSKPKVNLSVSAGPGRAAVPGTAGLTEQDAVAMVEDAGFEARVRSAASEEVDAGLVIHSEPSGGTVATHGSTVVLTISKGPKPATVPVLVGTQRGVAVQQIRASGLVPDVSETEDPAPPGEVIRQTPSAGSTLSRGSTVSIVVSKGEREVTVPDVVGQERAEAVQTLRDAGLTPTVEEQETESFDQLGSVITQFPPAGAEVEQGTSVTLVVGVPTAEP